MKKILIIAGDVGLEEIYASLLDKFGYLTNCLGNSTYVKRRKRPFENKWRFPQTSDDIQKVVNGVLHFCPSYIVCDLDSLGSDWLDTLSFLLKVRETDSQDILFIVAVTRHRNTLQKDKYDFIDIILSSPIDPVALINAIK